ncbi:hypothetical protein IFT98_18215 [Pseudomonas sp. CFBP 8770]|uniref:hypothetical protein n=1 Tax=unclassified Pseudomonas TaxID=196821 RepID=UPI00177E12A9|nr:MULTISPECIES: hypothetical protein [unclassified Pseudomonas]MBD8476149.1 hypothetical protein [Pseudomonas sp. CFBP 8773]MBD8648931.1 hypothetical protein [Pseudomonas sp. CFBP 8770]
MKKAAPQYQRNSLSQGHFNLSLNCLLFCGSLSSLLITTAQFALYWLLLGAMMTSPDCRIEEDDHFIFDEAFLLLDGYASSIPSESIVFGGFLTPQEA